MRKPCALAECLITFRTHRSTPGRKYHAPECADKARSLRRRKRTVLPPIPCQGPDCSVIFVPGRPWHKYHDAPCRDRARIQGFGFVGIRMSKELKAALVSFAFAKGLSQAEAAQLVLDRHLPRQPSGIGVYV